MCGGCGGGWVEGDWAAQHGTAYSIADRSKRRRQSGAHIAPWCPPIDILIGLLSEASQ